MDAILWSVIYFNRSENWKSKLYLFVAGVTRNFKANVAYKNILATMCTRILDNDIEYSFDRSSVLKSEYENQRVSKLILSLHV